MLRHTHRTSKLFIHQTLLSSFDAATADAAVQSSAAEMSQKDFC